MGVPNSQKYTISKHAAMRIRTRFNVPPTKVPGWVHRFLGDAKFFQNDENSKDDEVQVYKKDEVLMVLNVKEFIVVTAYPYNPFNKTNGLSEAILEKLQPSLNSIVNKERVALRDDLDGLMMDLQMSFQAYQNHPRSDKMLQEYIRVLGQINARLDTSKALIKDIDELKS
jgi:hypothetical protein